MPYTGLSFTASPAKRKLPIFGERDEIIQAKFISDDLSLFNLVIRTPKSADSAASEDEEKEEAPQSYWTVMDQTGRLIEMENDLKKVLEKDTWTSAVSEATTNSTTVLMLMSDKGHSCASVEFNMQGKVIAVSQFRKIHDKNLELSNATPLMRDGELFIVGEAQFEEDSTSKDGESADTTEKQQQ